jgi:DNA mismatch repair protein MutS2
VKVIVLYDKSLEMLEFPKIKEILAGYTSFSASRQLALSLQPSTNSALISQLLKQSAEARHLLTLEPDFSVRGALDVREAVQMAARSKVLEPQTLVEIQMTLAAARYVHNSLKKHAKELPSLWDIADHIAELPSLENEIGRCITPAGEIMDSASAKLGELRHRLKETRQQLLDRLEAIMRSPRGRRFIQASFVAEREGRYVIPVKSESRKEIRGIVHDISNTGATAFVEPWATVEMGNELRELTIEETREVERILLELSTEIGEHEADISQDVELLAELDLTLAKARYAGKFKAVEPHIAPDGVLRLDNARHPLLKGKAVPLSVEIGQDYSILVITGPNTGGKTVALKTIGLLTLMAQAGMPIPASEESSIPIVDGVFADIGDEQSIEQTLSTFSSHMGNIVRIIGTSTEKSLVLLDELGTSTDPNEGAALARAILLHFLSKKTMAVATTHYSDLKIFAHTTPGLKNASLDFDPVTLAPTYHLTMGIPGGSNALAIASQLGLPPEIVSKARDMLAKGTQEIETLLKDMMGEKQRMESLRSALEKETNEAEKLRGRLERERKELKEREQGLLREAKDRLAEQADDLQRQIRDTASELKKAKSQESIEQAKKALSSVREQLKSEKWKVEPVRSDETEEVIEAGKIAVGNRVWLRDMETWGNVLSLPDSEGQFEVQVGQTRLRLNMDNVEKVMPPSGKVLPLAQAVKKDLSPKPRSYELDLRGKRAEEVGPELDGYLNDVSVANFSQVRIIHGFGTGVVRQIVRDILASHPLVKSFRPGERGGGGDGVTVVEL